MAQFSQRSKDKLATCHNDLQTLFNEVISRDVWDCTVLSGHRDKEEQDTLYEQGRSQLKFPHSKHNTYPSTAVDVAPYFADKPHIRWNDLEAFEAFGHYVKNVAKELDIKIEWGGDWYTFVDMPHFQLKD